MVSALATAQRLSVKALAERAGIHRNRLYDKIAGRQAFTEQDILRLAAELNVPAGRLFEDPLQLLGAAPLDVTSSPSSLREVGRSEGMQNLFRVA
jgi:transcriptional regulator with XRE-family HTH domain